MLTVIFSAGLHRFTIVAKIGWGPDLGSAVAG